MQSRATIFIVDDNQDLAEALALNLVSEGYDVKCFSEAQNFLTAYSPDTLGCLLLDVRMPGMTGDELQDALIKNDITIPIIFMSGYSDVPVVVSTLKKGAVDFLAKPIDQYMLLKTIHKALELDIAWRNKRQQNQAILDRAATLTPREKELMKLIVKGKLNKTIADELDISINTVENHRAKIMHKMEAKTIAELVCMALLNSLVAIELEEEPEFGQ